MDGGRINTLLNMRQLIGVDHAVQEAFRYLLMDHDLFHRDGDDYLVPPPSSQLWERLPTPSSRYLCRREAKRFYALDDEDIGSKKCESLNRESDLES